MDELQAIVRFTFHAGMVGEFKRLSAECLEIVRSKDVGTLQYDTYFNDDESQAIVLERFHDSDALILHGQNMAPLMDAIMATADVSGDSSATRTSSSGRNSPAARSVCSRCTSRCSAGERQRCPGDSPSRPVGPEAPGPIASVAASLSPNAGVRAACDEFQVNRRSSSCDEIGCAQPSN